MLRSTLAVILGIATLLATSFAIEPIFPPTPWPKAFMFLYGSLCIAAGGYVTARVARRAPLKHALAMGVTQAALTIIAMFSPEAYRATTAQWILNASSTIPAALVGGVLYAKRKQR